MSARWSLGGVQPKRAYIRWSEAKDDKLRALYANCLLSLSAVALKLDVSMNALKGRIAQLDLPRRRPRVHSDYRYSYGAKQSDIERADFRIIATHNASYGERREITFCHSDDDVRQSLDAAIGAASVAVERWIPGHRKWKPMVSA